MKILFRSCGGLGNQIFQLFFTRLLAEKLNTTNIVHYHESNYARIAYWEYPLNETMVGPSTFELIIIKLRIPQFLYKFKLTNKEYVKFGNTIIIDGYFQNLEYYKYFSTEDLICQLDRLRNELVPDFFKNVQSTKLVHFRLGDFFKTEYDQLEFICKYLEKIDEGTTLISNRDDLFLQDIYIKNKLKKCKLNYIETDSYNSIDLFGLFAQFKSISSNGSTFALWASILAKSELQLVSQELNGGELNWMLDFKNYLNFN